MKPKPKPKHNPIANLKHFAHPPNAAAAAKAKLPRTHLDKPKTPEKAKVVVGRKQKAKPPLKPVKQPSKGKPEVEAAMEKPARRRTARKPASKKG